MKKHVTPQQVEDARRVPVQEYLLSVYPECFRIDQDTGDLLTVQNSTRGSSILTGAEGTQRIHLQPPFVFANGIDFLMKYLEYDFIDAVKELCRYQKSRKHDEPRHSDSLAFVLPGKAQPPFRELFGHMRYRNIPYEISKGLVRNGLLYQDASRQNAVFLSKDRDYYEVMGIRSYSRFPYFRYAQKASEAFWSVRNMPDQPLRHICITLSAMDAVSLWILEQKADVAISTAYTSIGHRNRWQAVTRILHLADRLSASVFLAMDSESAAYIQYTWKKRFDCFLPQTHGWNEDLMKNYSFSDPVYTYGRSHSVKNNSPETEDERTEAKDERE